jgi:hypothetical protein
MAHSHPTARTTSMHFPSIAELFTRRDSLGELTEIP